MGFAVSGQTPPVARASRSPHCLGGQTPSRHSWVRVSGTFVCFSFSLLSEVVLAGPPLGLPAAPTCPSFSVSRRPHASHRQTVTCILHLRTTGECCPATAWSLRGPCSACRGLPGGGRVGPAAQPPRAPGGGQCRLCPSRSGWPGQRGAAVARASHRSDGRSSRAVNGLPVLARGAEGRPGGCESGRAAPRGSEGQGASCSEAWGRRWRWRRGWWLLGGAWRSVSRGEGLLKRQVGATPAEPRGCWEPQSI